MPSKYPSHTPIKRPRRLYHAALAPAPFLPVLLWLERTWTAQEAEIRQELRRCEGFHDWLLALAQALGNAIDGGLASPAEIERDIGLPSLATLVRERLSLNLKHLLLQLLVAWLWAEGCTPTVADGLLLRQRKLASYESELALRNQLKHAEPTRELLGRQTTRRALWHLITPPRLVIVHAGADRERATEIERALSERAPGLPLARAEATREGDLLAELDESMGADTALILWSAASARAWSGQDGLSSIDDAAGRLSGGVVIGRLDSTATPEGLHAQDTIDLYPAVLPGLERLLGRWQRDRAAEIETARAVVAPRSSAGRVPGDVVLYISSELLDRTIRIFVSLEGVPSGVYLDRTLEELSAPRKVELDGRVLLYFDYKLFHGGRRLERELSFGAQGVSAGEVVLLGCKWRAAPVSSRPPVDDYVLHGDSLGAEAAGEEARAALRRAFAAALSDRPRTPEDRARRP